MKRSHPKLLKKIHKIPIAEQAVSVVTMAELLYGATKRLCRNSRGAYDLKPIYSKSQESVIPAQAGIQSALFSDIERCWVPACGRGICAAAPSFRVIAYFFHPEAGAELEEATVFYESRMAGLGKFLATEVARRARIASRKLNKTPIMNSHLLQQASVLPVDKQIELVEAIWDGIVSRGAAPSLTEAQTTELDRRLADHLANPNDVVSWGEVKAAALAKIGQ